MARGDFIEKRGSAVVTDSLTYVGAGGVDVDSAPIKSGTTAIVNATGISSVSIDPATVDGVVHMYHFGGVTINATDAAVRLPPLGESVTTLRYSLPKAGSVVHIAAFGNTACTAGHATFTVWIGTTTTGFGATINTTASQVATATQAKDTDTFAAGKTLGIKVVNSSFAATATMVISVGVEM